MRENDVFYLNYLSIATSPLHYFVQMAMEYRECVPVNSKLNAGLHVWKKTFRDIEKNDICQCHDEEDQLKGTLTLKNISFKMNIYVK